MKRARIIAWAMVALAVAGFALLLLRTPGPVEAPKAQAVAAPSAPFTLVGADGKPFASSSLAGTPHVLFFGFTHCPDTCPTTLARLVKLRRDLGHGDDSFAILFVTVDPERDDPKAMGAYANAFGAPVIGLTGSAPQIAAVKKEFGIYAQKVPLEGGDYTVDHTATVLLFDRNGAMTGTIAPDEQDAPALDKLKRLTAA